MLLAFHAHLSCLLGSVDLSLFDCPKNRNRRKFGLLKKIAHRYRYDLTRLGRSAIAAACRITEQTIVPALAGAAA
jgi:hypothetical protein